MPICVGSDLTYCSSQKDQTSALNKTFRRINIEKRIFQTYNLIKYSKTKNKKNNAPVKIEQFIQFSKKPLFYLKST